MKITVIGTGYVGLVTGACLADIGHDVVCLDKDAAKISALENGDIPIYEPTLDEVVVRAKKLAFTTDLPNAIHHAEILFLAVGTPQSDSGEADLSQVKQAVDEIAPQLQDGVVIVTKSTVPVGTGKQIKAWLSELTETSFDIASNPEFLREGSAVNDFMNPDRIVIGAENQETTDKMLQIYASFQGNTTILTTDIATAEITKYAANAFLATKIGFINEIADICTVAGANVEDVAHGMGLDHRIAASNLKPGPGFGGSCFPKDTMALCSIAHEAGVPTTVVEAVIESNGRRKKRMVQVISDCLGGNVKGKSIAILGLAFKANTDDIRYSPSLVIIPELEKLGAKLRLHDPEAIENFQTEISLANATYHDDLNAAMKAADAVVVLTEWQDYKELQPTDFTNKICIDLRNLYDKDEMQQEGISYYSIGR